MLAASAQALRASVVRATNRRTGRFITMAASAVSSQAAPNAAVTALKPNTVFQLFSELARFPRPSKHEQKVAAWLKEFALSRNLDVKQDAKGNTVIYKGGQAGGEAAPPIILQGHIDMVCEANASSTHNFMTDPIKLVLGGDGWLRADGTTLGADNGVGVAAVLAVLALAPDVPCPPIEALFTVEEEIGLVGAMALDASMLTGKTLLNLDSEDWGVIYIGCAGAGESALTLDVNLETVTQQDLLPCKLCLSGLAGGHSGLQIHTGLGNAVQLLARALQQVQAAAPGTRLVDLKGGDKRNAIPREASADILVPPSQLVAARAAVASCLSQLQQVYGSVEADLALSLTEHQQQQQQHGSSEGAAVTRVISPAGTTTIIDVLSSLPHGPVRMSPAMPGLVETSNNLASIKLLPPTDSGKASYSIIVTTRSSLPPALANERSRIAAVAKLAGAKVEQPADYAGWAPNPDSKLLALTKEIIAKYCGHEPHVTAIHAGLECGVLGSVLGGDVEMVSYGPTILGAHSPAERLQVSTVKPFWEATLAMLAELAKRR